MRSPYIIVQLHPISGKHATDIIRTAFTFTVLLLSTSTILHSCDHPTDDMETEPSAAHVFHTKVIHP